MRRAPAVVAALLVCTSAAWATPVVITDRDDELRWQIDLPAAWSAVPRDELESGKALAAFASGRKRLIVLRLRGNTDGAFDGKPGYFAGLEDGVKKESPDFRRLSGTVRKLGKKKKTPGYDLWYRAGDTLRGVRFIFLKNYCLMGTVELPETTAIPRDARHVLESLGPAP